MLLQVDVTSNTWGALHHLLHYIKQCHLIICKKNSLGALLLANKGSQSTKY